MKSLSSLKVIIVRYLHVKLQLNVFQPRVDRFLSVRRQISELPSLSAISVQLTTSSFTC